MSTSALVRLGSFSASLLAFVALSAPAATLTACSTDGSGDDDDDGGSTCNGAVCTSTEFCLYRVDDTCTPSTDTSCPSGTIPADCNGSPGCQGDGTTATVQGCRTIPATCGGDITCACQNVCGSVDACQSVSGTSAVCT